MNYQLEKTDTNLSSIKQNFNFIINEIKKTEDTKFINETIDKVKLAREWAKIQKKTEEMYSDLLKIEIECFRRIFQLKCINVLHVNKRKMAEFYGEMTEEEVKKLIKNNSGLSAYKIYRDYNCDYGNASWQNRGHDFAKGIPDNISDDMEGRTFDDSEIEKTFNKYSNNHDVALATLLDDFSTRNESFTVSEFADDLIEKLDLQEYNHEKNIKTGIMEVCRGALTRSKTFYVKDKKTPRFVTCYNDIIDQWVRIPFENANLEQFSDMIKLRKKQLEDDKKALDNLVEIFDILNESYSELLSVKKLKKNQKIIISDIISNI